MNRASETGSSRRYTMRDVPAAERPRERLVRYGADKLSGEELLAVLISRGTSGVPVREIAHELLVRFGSVAGIAEASIEELKRVPGIGLAKACQLKAAFELARRYLESQVPEQRLELTSPEVVVKLLLPRLIEKKKECFFTVLLDARNRHIRTEQVSVGSLDTTLAHPREVFDAAVHDHAPAVILVHNHPSGDPTPSDEDIRLTKRLVEAGKLLGIRVQDHIIIAGSSYYSFRSRGLL
ncbi:MAG: DNA repair protein RadC [candidate division WOR-3 bacterium]